MESRGFHWEVLAEAGDEDLCVLWCRSLCTCCSRVTDGDVVVRKVVEKGRSTSHRRY